MLKKHKTYLKPKRPFDKARIDSELKIKRDFGLKNKREIWKAEAKVKAMREKAKSLIKESEEEQQKLFDQLKKIGLEVNAIGDVLALEAKDYLERRLQTIVAKKGLAPTIRSARQMISHRRVYVDGRVVDKPSFIVPVELEDKIEIKASRKQKKPQSQESSQEENKQEAEAAAQ